MLLARQSAVAQKAAYPAAVSKAAAPRAGAVCRSFTVPFDLLAAGALSASALDVPILAAQHPVSQQSMQTTTTTALNTHTTASLPPPQPVMSTRLWQCPSWPQSW
jgi:hypothetical protein